MGTGAGSASRGGGSGQCRCIYSSSIPLRRRQWTRLIAKPQPTAPRQRHRQLPPHLIGHVGQLLAPAHTRGGRQTRRPIPPRQSPSSPYIVPKPQPPPRFQPARVAETLPLALPVDRDASVKRPPTFTLLPRVVLAVLATPVRLDGTVVAPLG